MSLSIKGEWNGGDGGMVCVVDDMVGIVGLFNDDDIQLKLRFLYGTNHDTTHQMFLRTGVPFAYMTFT